MKVFSKELFFKENVYNCKRYCEDADVRRRVDLAEGEPVIGGQWNGWIIKESWTKEVNNPVEESGKILNTYFPHGFPEPEPQAVNCRCEVLKEAPPKHPRYKIVIECNDDFTTAQMFVDGHQVKGEAAKRNPADKFNWRIGAQTAFNRLWEKKKPKPVVREVKRHAEPGEYIKIVNSDGCRENEYKNGDILKVVCASRDLWPSTPGAAFYKDAFLKYAYPREYVVLEGYKPE